MGLFNRKQKAKKNDNSEVYDLSRGPATMPNIPIGEIKKSNNSDVQNDDSFREHQDNFNGLQDEFNEIFKRAKAIQEGESNTRAGVHRIIDDGHDATIKTIKEGESILSSSGPSDYAASAISEHARKLADNFGYKPKSGETRPGPSSSDGKGYGRH